LSANRVVKRADTSLAPALGVQIVGVSGAPALLIVLPLVSLEEGVVLERVEGTAECLFFKLKMEDGFELSTSGILSLQTGM
jgi:hypothetical protein